MATPNEQLKLIYTDLKDKFDSHRYISVIPFDDDPPEKYEIRYTILGVAQDSDGKVIETRDHSIFINIPFGFPHFPPSCTPQTATFHPDFDQAAICIGDFWNRERTLPELIVHIGKMISGEIFSTENAFNEAAVAWYNKNASRLPFERIDLSAREAADQGEAFLEISEDDLVEQGIDTLDDNDISSPTDYLDPGKKDFGDPDISFPTTAQTSGKGSVNRIHLLIRQKRYFELSKFLHDLPIEDQFEDREEIETNISNLLTKAKGLQKEADEFEHQGDPKMALELFQKVAEMVPDFPNIQENIDRTRKSVDLADDWSLDGQSSETDVSDDASTVRSKKRVAFFEETTKATIRFLPILGVILVGVLAISFVTPYFNAKSQLEESVELYDQCKKNIEINRFTSAKQFCEDAQEALGKISFFMKKDRNSMQRQIQQTLTSDKMVQGLSGRVFFQGKFVKRSDMEKVLEFNGHKKEADDFFNQSNWRAASSTYAIALKTAEPIQDSIEVIVLREVKDKIVLSDIHMALERGESLLSRGELERSKEMLSDALKKAEKLPEELGGSLITQITPKLQEIEYLQHLDLGKKYFYSNDWESAIKQYEKALRLQDSKDVNVKDVDVKSLYTNMAEAELYSFINSAKDSFSQDKLDEAIEQYQKAIELLNEKRNLLQRINPDEIRQQLQRIILRARIVQYKQAADQQLGQKQYNEAITSFEEVINAVTSSGFQDDKEFSSIIIGTRKTIEETRKNAVIAGRISYLVENYKEIFEAHYSAAIPEYLSKPKAEFLKNINGKELYEIECLETNRGRKLRLVMQYTYDPARNKWEFYSEAN